jgi:hypothetical protein
VLDTLGNARVKCHPHMLSPGSRRADTQQNAESLRNIHRTEQVMEETPRSQQNALSDPTAARGAVRGTGWGSHGFDTPASRSSPRCRRGEHTDILLSPEGRTTGLAPSAPLKVVLVCAAAFVVPGAGHALLGRWGRALLLFLAIMGMFAAGLLLFGGRFYTFNPEEPLSIFPLIAHIGLGSVYALCVLTRTGLDARPELTTYEYGNAFLLVAGLLNYLAVLDAFDIALGRKK